MGRTPECRERTNVQQRLVPGVAARSHGVRQQCCYYLMIILLNSI
jgi:hypothetical protein